MTALDDHRIAADHAYIEHLRAGGQPLPDDHLGRMLAAWRDDARDDTGDDTAWRPLVPPEHAAHVDLALLILVVGLTSGALLATPTAAALLRVAAICAWITLAVVVIVGAHDRDQQLAEMRRVRGE